MDERKLADAINRLTDAINVFASQQRLESHNDRPHGGFVSHFDLIQLEHRIMSKISEFAVNQNAFNDRVDAAITGLTGDVQTLNDTILQLQTTPGEITPEDQALLDSIQARSEGIATKLEALDALTPPKPPVA